MYEWLTLRESGVVVGGAATSPSPVGQVGLPDGGHSDSSRVTVQRYHIHARALTHVHWLKGPALVPALISTPLPLHQWRPGPRRGAPSLVAPRTHRPAWRRAGPTPAAALAGRYLPTSPVVRSPSQPPQQWGYVTDSDSRPWAPARGSFMLAGPAWVTAPCATLALPPPLHFRFTRVRVRPGKFNQTLTDLVILSPDRPKQKLLTSIIESWREYFYQDVYL